jgi:hypothetical protein
MHSPHLRRFGFLLLMGSLIFLFAACGSQGSNPGATPTAGSGTPGQTPDATTVPMPPTQTDCPATGTARAAVTRTLALGSHQNIVYIVDEYPANNTIGTLKRYDITTGNKTEIVKLNGMAVLSAQISSDGQWILFTAIPQNGPTRLQLVRMDGQGLQTLYCSQSIRDVQWSTNQKLIVFSANSGLYLLDASSGSLQLEIKPADSGPPLHFEMMAFPFTWLDSTRLYVRYSSAPIGPIDTLALLDTSKGANQNLADLQVVYQWKETYQGFNYECWDADSSFDGSKLFIDTCAGINAPNCSGSCILGTREGPSDINMKDPAGGLNATQKHIFASPTMGIASVRAISSQHLLLDIENFSRNHTVDRSQNGLWLLNTDGTGLTRLTTESANQFMSLNPDSQTPWANVSRDGDSYAVQLLTYSGPTNAPHVTTYALAFGSLNGGAPTTFASISDNTHFSTVGWTTM